MLAELAEGPLDGVALLVRLGVECGRAPAAAAAPVPVAGLVGRAPGYTSLGFPDPRRLMPTPSATPATNPAFPAEPP